MGHDGVYVIAFNKIIPAEYPSFESIKDRVTFDYKRNQAINATRMAGSAFAVTASNAVAQGKSFADVAKDAHVEAVSLPPFSLSSRTLPGFEDRLNLNTLKQYVFSTPVGKTTGFEPTAEGGMVLYVKEKVPLDQEKMKSELPMFVNYVRQSRQNEAFNEWFRHEAQRGLGDTPLARQQQQQQIPGARPTKS
jgi:hypothetical protein